MDDSHLSDDPAPQRREADLERRRWNDQALDQLAEHVASNRERVGDIEDQLIERVVSVQAGVTRLEGRLDEAGRVEHERVRDLHKRIDRSDDQTASAVRELRKEMRHRFDVVDEAHAVVAQRGVDWKTVMAVAATIVVPLLVAAIYATAH